MRKVFLDTVGLLAIWNGDDQWHEAATRAMQGIVARNTDGFCSTQVLLECGNAASRSDMRGEVVKFREAVIDAGHLIEPSQEELEEAWDAYSQRFAAGAGIVDQISFVLMRRLGITEVFSND